MSIVFTLDLSNPDLNKMTEMIDGTHPVLRNASSVTIKQSLPFVPDKELLDKYAEIIKEQYSDKDVKIEAVRFSHYASFTQDPDTLSVSRAKQIAFEVLQLIRQHREKEGHDPTDTDDLLFSELDIEKGELEEIFKPYNISVYGNSCFENGTSPKNYDTTYFS